MIDMLEKVKKTIKEQGLITPGDKVLVALSGGADSVCLLSALIALAREFGLTVSAAHVNHGLRGQDADEDEAFVRALCKEYGVTLYVHKADVASVAKAQKIGLEEAGRAVRYRFFDDVKNEHGFNKIATAHHACDNVETVLMRLMRGTGLKGLAGIPYRNGAVIRPLLDVQRGEVETYLAEQKLTYRTDLSNYETDFTRNRIRHELLPLIEEKFNPGFISSFSEQIRLYTAGNAYIEEEAENLFKTMAEAVPGGYGFACDALLTANTFLVSEMLHRLVSQLACGRDIAKQHIDAIAEILKAQSGAVTLPGDALAEVCHGKLYIRKQLISQAFSYAFDSEVFIEESNCRLTAKKQAELPETCGRNMACLDLKTLNGKRLCIRNRIDGDVFYPVGMDGKKKLQDFFVDQKVPYFMRDRVPILTADNDIVWIAGYRCDRRYAATKETDAVLCVEIHEGDLT